MRYLGDYAPSDTVRGFFNTHQADGTPITLAGSPVLSVYKDGGTTESTAGVTLTVGFDSRTGLHMFVIDTSADGTFYSAGSDFEVVITTGTVNGTSVVGTTVGKFSIRNRRVVTQGGVRKNTALSNFEFPMVLSLDHQTAAAGLTVTAKRSIDGGAFANCANSVSEVGSGVYKIDLAAADLNGDVITLLFTATGADPRRVTIKTVP